MKRENASFLAGQLGVKSDFIIDRLMALSFFDSRIAIVRDVPPDYVQVVPEDEIIDGLIPVISRSDVLNVIVSQ